MKDPELVEMLEDPALRLWCGPDSHVVAYTLRHGELFNLALMIPDDLPPEVSRQKANVDQLRAIFNNWDPRLKSLLNMVNEVEKWKLMHRESLHFSLSEMI